MVWYKNTHRTNQENSMRQFKPVTPHTHTYTHTYTHSGHPVVNTVAPVFTKGQGLFKEADVNSIKC